MISLPRSTPGLGVNTTEGPEEGQGLCSLLHTRLPATHSDLEYSACSASLPKMQDPPSHRNQMIFAAVRPGEAREAGPRF